LKEDEMRILKTIAIMLALVWVSALVAQAVCPGDMMDTLCSKKELSTTAKMVRAAGLEDELRACGPMTLFAPTNKAWSKFPNDCLCTLMKPENRDTLRNILLYHLLKCKLTSCDIMKLDCPTQFTTVQGSQVTISHKGKTIMVGCAKVVKADICSTNGVIHEIDTVLIPPGLTLPCPCPAPCPCPNPCPSPCPSPCPGPCPSPSCPSCPQ
jgi:uncharacterized surface protein with fasciclin (FAS1) repeats